MSTHAQRVADRDRALSAAGGSAIGEEWLLGTLSAAGPIQRGSVRWLLLHHLLGFYRNENAHLCVSILSAESVRDPLPSPQARRRFSSCPVRVCFFPVGSVSDCRRAQLRNGCADDRFDAHGFVEWKAWRVPRGTVGVVLAFYDRTEELPSGAVAEGTLYEKEGIIFCKRLSDAAVVPFAAVSYSC